jgi:hypothetical protein
MSCALPTGCDDSLTTLRGRDCPVIYLDFDGVLHPEDVYRHPRRGIHLAPRYSGHQLFEHGQALARELQPHPSVMIVLSTSWVRILGYSRTSRFLPPELQARTVGATYHSRMSDDAFLELGRGMQIVGDVGRRKPSCWIAIDDDDSVWPDAYRSRLLKTDSLLGLPTVLADLRTWLQAVTLPERQGADALPSNSVLDAAAAERLWLAENQAALESSNAFVKQSGLPLGECGGLTGSVSRGTWAKSAWVQAGELVSAQCLAERWSCTPEQLETATRLEEVFAISEGGKPFYPREFIELSPTIVMAVMKAMGTLDPFEKLVFWKRRHGALGDRTVAQVLTSESDHRRLERVLQLAQAWSSEGGRRF